MGSFQIRAQVLFNQPSTTPRNGAPTGTRSSQTIQQEADYFQGEPSGGTSGALGSLGEPWGVLVPRGPDSHLNIRILHPGSKHRGFQRSPSMNRYSVDSSAGPIGPITDLLGSLKKLGGPILGSLY